VVEGGQAVDDDGGGKWAGRRRWMMGGATRPQTSMRNGMVSERTSERGWELTGGGSAPKDLSTVSWDNKDDGDVFPDVPVVGSAVVTVPTTPDVEFRNFDAGVGWDRQSSTTTAPFGLPSSWEVLLVFIFVYGAMRP
jgi:hypothetical protein